MAAKYVAWFSELSKNDVGLVGGKGANLGEMYNAKFPVPPGFVITAKAYQDYVKDNKIDSLIKKKLNKLNVEDTKNLQKIAKELQEAFLKNPMPIKMQKEITNAYYKIEKSKNTFVAVRSSATAEDLPTASFAGQQASFMNVHGYNGLIDAVQKCWASLFTARAIYYRVKNKFDHSKVALAAVVQKMVNSEVAGVMFSINPVTNNDAEIVINAGWGLGDAVVAGEVNPDEYIVDESTIEIKKAIVNKQTWIYTKDAKGNTVKKDLPIKKQKAQVLTQNEIEFLAKLSKKVEEHYGIPMDMEWAGEKGKLYLVQARPVTTVKATKTEKPSEFKLEKAIVKGFGASPGIASGPVKIIKDATELDKIKQGDVLVTKMTNPDMVPGMQKAVAIVTDEGGITSHAAIVSREMMVPCCVGTGNATKVLKNKQIITVDGTNGLVFEGAIKKEVSAPKTGAPLLPHEQLITVTKVKVIMDLPDFAERAAATGADGVGLQRLEGIIATNRIHPVWFLKKNKMNEYVKIIEQGLEKTANAFAGKPVWVRTSDIRSDEYRNLKGGKLEPYESNPMMGWHGIRRSLDQPQILQAEFQAIKNLHNKGLKNLGVFFPQIISVNELRRAKQICRTVGLEPRRDVEFGVMIETPASVWIIEELCKEGIDFISFGTNDLTQFTLALDRNNEVVQKLYDPTHPAILRQIAYVIKVCKKYGVETSICGQAGSDPRVAEFLVKHGIDSISANPDAVQKIRETVYRTEKKILLEKSLSGV